MESSSLLPLFPCSMMVSRARVLYSCRAAEEFRKGGGTPGREAAAAESPPSGSNGRREAPGRGSRGRQAARPPRSFSKN